MKMILFLLSLFIAGQVNAQELALPNSQRQVYAPQYPQYPPAQVVVVPRNNLEASVQFNYNLEATRNLQLQNELLAEKVYHDTYKLPESNYPTSNKGQFEIIE